ncbi:MAG: hypothetical protein EA368_10015 [Leptolyngbya sp. DLM2.Bin27]|nr:MAG: hypothetical protein EA368_10015 [Leptolyngbya sp. DLM2.Bin27]
MALPPLDHFLSRVPAYHLAASLGEITQALGQPGAAAPSHIVVTDDEHRPLGAVALGQLWAAHYVWSLEAAEVRFQRALLADRQLPGQALAADQPAGPQLIDCQPWLEPVVEVVASQLLDPLALADLGRLAQTVPAPTLVMVDADGQYLGMLNPVKLLGWLATAALRGSEPSSGDRAAGEQRIWVLELSHALKTPITTLLGLSTLLLDSRVGALCDRQFRYVSLMRQAIRKLNGLVNLLLDWMRLESDQITLTLERISLQPLADDLVTSFLTVQPEAVASGWVEGFKVHLATAESWIMADPLRLRQSLHYSLSYLLAHGIEPSGLMIEPWGGWVGFTLWSSAFRPTAALGAEGSGTSDIQHLQGLGLTLARRFSQLHGGEVSLLTTPAWGSRLTLLLPAPPSLGQTQATALVLVACASEAVIEQVYGCLRGTDYRLAIAPCCQTLTAMQGRLTPACTLIHWESLPDAPTQAAARQALMACLAIARSVVLRSLGAGPDADDLDPPAEAWVAGGHKVLAVETIAQGLRPMLDEIYQRHPVPISGLTMLLLRPLGSGDGPSTLSTSVQTWLQRYRCRLLQVDDLAQASLLSRVWQPQAVILDRSEPLPLVEFEALARHPDLARLPLITLVPGAAEAAVQALGLTLVHCPEVLSQPPSEAVRRLMQAIAARRPTPEA